MFPTDTVVLVVFSCMALVRSDPVGSACNLVLSNSFVEASFSLCSAQLTSLRGRYDANNVWGQNILANSRDPLDLNRVGLVLETDTTVQGLWPTTVASSMSLGPPLKYEVHENSTNLLFVTVFGVKDARNSALVTSDWSLLLAADSRRINISIAARATQTQANLSAVRVSLYARPHAVVAWFERGVLQTMDSSRRLFASNSSFERLYATSTSSGYDVTATGHSATVVISDGNAVMGRSGVQFVLVGRFPTMDEWTDDWRFALPVGISKGDSYKLQLSLSPSDGPYPAVGIENARGAHFGLESTAANTNLRAEDMASILNGIFSNAVAGLTTYQLPGMIADELVHPVRTSYHDLYTFGDPTIWSHTAAMAYSGRSQRTHSHHSPPIHSRTISNQATRTYGHKLDLSLRRSALISLPRGRCLTTMTAEATRSLRRFCPSRFILQFLVLHRQVSVANINYSAGEQHTSLIYESCCRLVVVLLLSCCRGRFCYCTGPNIFFIEAACTLAKFSGNIAWLDQMLPSIDRAADFLLASLDPDLGLVSTTGSLWVDTLRRGNFTLDTNAFLSHTLQVLSGVHAHLGHKEAAEYYKTTAVSMIQGLNKHLWSSEGDHFVTQLNADKNTTRDFVDYDGNLLAVALNVVPANSTRAAKILARIDSGPCTHVGVGTFISEKPYLLEDCFADNIGDSVVSTARYAWADAHARAAVGDYTTFYNTLLQPIMEEQASTGFMYERYTCHKPRQPVHSPYYTEYPETAARLLIEIKYGINVELDSISVKPFGPEAFAFEYHLGLFHVHYEVSRLHVHYEVSRLHVHYEVSRLHVHYEVSRLHVHYEVSRLHVHYEVSRLHVYYEVSRLHVYHEVSRLQEVQHN
jgi:hypothetical protein